ncbi:MAG: tandem-95 repeat protein, partial [Actinobacteria bacterium]|nr:tandem-95 repeat protein [Actinomycetota bacterium]
MAPTCGTAIVQPISPTNPAPQSPRTERVGVFDAGTGAAPTGLWSITNVQATNATVSVPANGTSYLNFNPGQTGPLPITATRTAAAESANLPMHWSFDATDAAGNVTHCRGAMSPPVAGNDNYSANEATPLTVAAPGVLGNDTDPDGNALTASLVGAPANGTVTLNADGSFTYTPNAGFNGPDSFTYKANDGTFDSNVATVTITVAAVNDAPAAADDTVTTAEDTPVTVAAPGVLGNDTDPESDTLNAVKVSDPANGTVTLNADGSYTYTPNAGFNGSDSFTYKANDGTLDSNVATVTITIAAVNDAPVAADDTVTTAEDTPVTVAAPGVLGNDSDADGDTLSAAKVSDPANGTVTLNANGSYTYTPDANFNGTDSFTYKASDGTADSNVATVAITVTAVNDVPVAGNDAYSTGAGSPLTVNAAGVLLNDADADGDGLSAGSASNPAGGSVTLNADGSFTYTPDAGFSGADTFTYAA